MRTLRLTLTLSASLTLLSARAEADPGPIFIHESLGLNVVTYVGSYQANPSATLTPANHVMVFEQIGVGYWILPHWRLQLTGMFGETLSGLKPAMAATATTPATPAQSGYTLGAIIPWLVYTNRGFFAGAGPMIAPRAFGHDDFNDGLFTCGGYAFQLGGGISLAAAVQVPILVTDRVSVAVTPALILGERF